MLSSLRASSTPIQMRDARADRQAHVPRTGDHAIVDNPDVRSDVGTEPVRESGSGIGFVDDQRRLGSAGCQVSRHCRISTEPDHHCSTR